MLEILAALGARPDEARGQRLRRSPHYRDGAFRNSTPTSTLRMAESRRTLRDFMSGRSRPGIRPASGVTREPGD